MIKVNENDYPGTKLQSDLANDDQVDTISFNNTVKDMQKSIEQSMDLIIAVIIIASMSLAFVVLGNLTNINISERTREIATLKVLGFYPSEVQNYIYKENHVLVLIGALLGMPVGIFLHHWIMNEVEMDYIMYGRDVSWSSHLISILLTIGFGYLVDFFMKKKLRSIDMVESLKSVE
jgi:putative ABC transport system permease protein